MGTPERSVSEADDGDDGYYTPRSDRARGSVLSTVHPVSPFVLPKLLQEAYCVKCWASPFARLGKQVLALSESTGLGRQEAGVSLLGSLPPNLRTLF